MLLDYPIHLGKFVIMLLNLVEKSRLVGWYNDKEFLTSTSMISISRDIRFGATTCLKILILIWRELLLPVFSTTYRL